MSEHDPNALPPDQTPPPEDAGSLALAEAMRSSFIIVQVIMVALVLVFLGSGFFTVGPSEAAIRLRMGKPVDGGKLLGPGAHWAFPAPIDSIVTLKITSLTNAESSIGWYQTAYERSVGQVEPPAMQKLNPAVWTYAITADTNIIHLWVNAKYHITDPTVFQFNFVDATAFLTNTLNNSLLSAASEFTVDAILTTNRDAFRERIQRQVNQVVDEEKLGITVDYVDWGASAPMYLKPLFNDVTKAMQLRQKLVEDAQTYATNVIAHAKGEADTRIRVADAIRKYRVDSLAAQADTFKKLLAQYQRDPKLFKTIKQMSVLANVYTNVIDKITIPPNSKEVRFQLNRELEAPTPVSIPNP